MKVYRWDSRENGDIIAVVRPDELFDLSELQEEQISRHEGALNARHRLDGEWDTYAWVFYDNPQLEVLQRELAEHEDLYAEGDAEDLEALRTR